MGFIVAIDGTAGSGKTTVTKIIAERENLISIDTGAMYRCVGLCCVRNEIKIEEIEKIKKVLENIKIEFKNEEGKQKVILNGEDVTGKIRTPEIDDAASKFSAIKEVRERIVPMQREMAEGKNIIMEGRDIGTVVFPNADVKVFLDGTPEERARRRYKQNLEKGLKCTYEELLKEMNERNRRDSERKISPLVKAEDAIFIDTTNLSIEEVVGKIINAIKEKREK